MSYNQMGGPGYPGGPQPGAYGGPPQQGYPGGPQPGYPGAPQAGYPGAPQAGYPGAPQAGYPGAPQPGYPGAPQPGYPGAPPPGQFGAPPPQQGVQVDPTLQAWFAAVDHDRSGKISVNELQQALVNGNWSHFNRETCRLMISMFDKDFSGTIDLYEFCALWQYIQQWKGTFERYDRDRSGAIEGHELHQAFTTMGYNVSPAFVQLVVVKFDTHARRSLNLDSFIQACVMLKFLTDAFKQRDTNMSGVVNFNYEDFMSMAVLNKV